ncbi:MAG: lysozyme inhibitor LprI family protein [Pseudomonadota bacterium]
MIRWIAPLLLLAAPAVAEISHSEIARTIRVCLDNVDRPEDCIGRYIRQCTSADGNDTTIAMVDCISAEVTAWDVLLNETYQETLVTLEDRDATGDVLTKETRRVPSLRAAQRAWIAYRDAECDLRYSLYGQGSLRTIVAANCLLTFTAERTIALRDMQGF